MSKEFKDYEEAEDYCNRFGLYLRGERDIDLVFPIANALVCAYESGVEAGILKVETGE